MVEDRIIDQTSEWRNFSTEASSHATDPNRVGGPRDEFMEDSGMNVKIIAKPGAHSGLAKIAQKSSQDAGDKSLARGFNVIKDFGERLGLPAEVINNSKSIFKSIVQQKKLKGRNLDSVVAAVLYESTRKGDNPRNLKG